MERASLRQVIIRLDRLARARQKRRILVGGKKNGKFLRQLKASLEGRSLLRAGRPAEESSPTLSWAILRAKLIAPSARWRFFGAADWPRRVLRQRGSVAQLGGRRRGRN